MRRFPPKRTVPSGPLRNLRSRPNSPSASELCNCTWFVVPEASMVLCPSVTRALRT